MAKALAESDTTGCDRTADRERRVAGTGSRRLDRPAQGSVIRDDEGTDLPESVVLLLAAFPTAVAQG